MAILVVVFETTGVARALDRGPVVTCCCGSHTVDHPCGCRTCPAGRARRVAAPAGSTGAANELDSEPDSATPQLGSCHVTSRAGAVTSLPAVPPLRAPLPSLRLASAGFPHSAAAPLRDRLLLASRPPP